MARPKKTENTMELKLSAAEEPRLSIEDMPLETMRDYRLYNEEATRLNKQLKMCRYPIKPCPVDLHPTERIVFQRKDQPTNPLKVFVSNDKIHFEKTLIPGKTYDLPKYIVSYLGDKGKSIWEWYENADGSRETRVAAKDPRFALKTVYNNHYE